MAFVFIFNIKGLEGVDCGTAVLVNNGEVIGGAMVEKLKFIPDPSTTGLPEEETHGIGLGTVTGVGLNVGVFFDGGWYTTLPSDELSCRLARSEKLSIGGADLRFRF